MKPIAVQRATHRYEALLDAAAHSYATHGYHRTTVKSIVETVGVATGTYYLYFPNKKASCLAIIDRLYEWVMAEIIAQRAPWELVLGKLSASIGATLRVFGRYEDYAKVVLIQAPGADPAFDLRIQQIQAELRELLAKDLTEAYERGELPKQDVQLTARCLVGCLHEVLLGWIRDREPPDLEEAVPGLLGFVLRGIGMSPDRAEAITGRKGGHP